MNGLGQVILAMHANANRSRCFASAGPRDVSDLFEQEQNSFREDLSSHDDDLEASLGAGTCHARALHPNNTHD